MAGKLIECVPNFSEGQSTEILNKIEEEIKSTPGVSLLGVDPGSSTNRTVFTFVGSPSSVVEAAFRGAKIAQLLIDMRKHSGEHPRLGAMDVCPFVPVRNATMEDCVQCAQILGERLGRELNIPIYLYGDAAKADYRKTVPQIRAGEYEGLAKKIYEAEWKPDLGPVEFIPTWGGTMVGARKFLLAYNVNVLGTKEQAHRIALDLREAGRGTKGEGGKLKALQGIGWWLSEANLAQISYNLTDYDITSLHTVYEESKKIGETLKVSIVGSELVGLCPLEPLLLAADFYMKKESLFILDEDQKVRLAIDRLGLNSLYPFDPKDRIVEWKVASMDPPKPLLDLSLTQFVYEVRARKAAPGGGSVAALVGSLGTALCSMVGLLTYGKKIWEDLDEQMRLIIPPFYSATQNLLKIVEDDTQAFDKYMEAIKLTKDEKSPESQSALLNAINVPLGLAKNLDSLWQHLEKLALIGNPNCLSDIQVGVKCIETGIWGARCNVLINVSSLTDEKLSANLTQEANELYEKAEIKCREILKKLEKK